MAAVQREPARQPVGQAVEHRHQPAVVGADEVDRLQRQVGAATRAARARRARPTTPAARRRRDAARGAVAAARAGAGGAARGRRARGRRRRLPPARAPPASSALARAPAPAQLGRLSIGAPRSAARSALDASSRRNSTTVMLSRPPASLAAAISASPASRRPRVGEQQLGDRAPRRASS